MEINYKQVGRRIAKRRRDLKIKQYELADKVYLTNNHISNIENGHTIPSLEAFVKICEILQVTPDYFLLGSIKHKTDKNIYDKLSLCSKESIEVISGIIDVFIQTKTNL